MNPILLSSLIAIGLALVGVVGDGFVKEATTTKGTVEIEYFIAGLLIYAVTAFGWFYVMKTMKLSTIGVFYAVSTVLFLTLAGFLFFGEHLNTAEWVGVTMAIASLAILGRFA